MTGTASTRDPDVHDPPALLAMVGGDRPLMREIIALFLTEAPRLMGNVRDAAANGDVRAVQFGAHALKGSVGNMAAPRAFKAASDVEALARAGQVREALEALPVLEQELAQLLAALTGLPPALIP